MGLSYFGLNWVKLFWFTAYQSLACYLMLNTVVRCISGHRYNWARDKKIDMDMVCTNVRYVDMNMVYMSQKDKN